MPRSFATLGLVALVLTTSLAGCLSAFEDEPVTTASTDAREMLLRPPGSDVTPTGKVKEFTLYLHRMDHELYPGARMQMWGFSLSEDPATATVPGPEIRVTEGDTVRVRLRSLVANFNHTLHWHGQHVPWDMDGVPFVSQDPVEPGEEFLYEFIAKPAGSYWYHCHVDAQHHVDMGMYGPFIVEPQDPSVDPPFDREVTLMLDDMDRFHLEGGQSSTGNLPQSGDPYDYETWARRQSQDTLNRNPQVADRVTGTPARPTRDWYPVTYAPYDVDYNTFLINGFAFPYTEPIMIGEGETLRMRFMNAGNQIHAMHLHGHHMLVTHKDGVLLANPYWADTVLIGPGERYDTYVVGNNPGVWDFHDHNGEHTQNDHIFPGGAMTMFVYEAYMDRVTHGGGHDHGGWQSGLYLDPRVASGGFVKWYERALP